MLKDMSNPSFLEITTIAHELLDYEMISLKPREKSHKLLDELLQSASRNIEDSKDGTFDTVRQEHGLECLRQIRTTLQDLGYRQVIGKKDYLTPMNTALRDKRLDPFNTAIIYFSIAQVSGLPLTLHLNGADIFLRYNCLDEFYWNPKEQSSALDKIDVTDLEQISLELTTEHIIAMHQVIKAHYFQSRKNHDRAIDYSNLVIREFPGYWLAHKIKGISQEQTGQLRPSIQSYRAAIRLNPSDNNTRNLLNTANQKRQAEDFAKFSEIMKGSIVADLND